MPSTWPISAGPVRVAIGTQDDVVGLRVGFFARGYQLELQSLAMGRSQRSELCKAQARNSGTDVAHYRHFERDIDWILQLAHVLLHSLYGLAGRNIHQTFFQSASPLPPTPPTGLRQRCPSKPVIFSAVRISLT